MSYAYDARRQWIDVLDVRREHWLAWADRLRHEAPEGAFWPLVGTRRSGKTWALRGIHAQVPEAARLDLRGKKLSAVRQAARDILLLDEPGPLLLHEGPALLDTLVGLREEGARILIAMSPREWAEIAALRPEGPEVCLKDLYTMPALSVDGAARLARTPRGADLLASLPPGWTHNPFLLELLLGVAEARPGATVEEVIRETLGESRTSQYKYLAHAFEEGLSAEQRALVRRAARVGLSGDSDDRQLLTRTGLLRPDGEGLLDPVLADHLPPPVVIHHVTDVHFGDKAANTADIKDPGEAAQRLGRDAGAEHPATTWLRWIQTRQRRPHLTWITGDLAERATPAEFALARAWLDALAPLLAPHPDLEAEDPRIALVPGNHDVDWGAAAGATREDRHRPFADAVSPHPHAELHNAQRRAPVVLYRRLGLSLALLGSAVRGGERDAGASPLDPGLVPDRDLKALEGHAWRTPLRVALVHHPVNPVPAGPEIRAYAGLLNAGAVKAALLKSQVALVLHGHQHQRWIGEERWHGSAQTLRFASAPSLGSREVGESRGFLELTLQREGDQRWELSIQPYVEQASTFVEDGPPYTFTVDARPLSPA